MAINKEYMSKALSQKDYDCPCVICSFLAGDRSERVLVSVIKNLDAQLFSKEVENEQLRKRCIAT
jgi:hypothetical protein